jgi:hypothetical protein
VTVVNPDFDDTETLIITFGSKQCVLDGVGLNQDGPGIYQLDGTPGTVTQQLDALKFTAASNGGPSAKTNFELKAISSDGLQTIDTATNVTASVACYTPGTLILTPCGEVAVERLAIGDIVVTASREKRRIKWIGHRSYAGRFLAANRNVQPIRFRAGSLGEGLPRRDLRVSPRHAMFLDGLLIPAACLTNGSTITQERGLERVDYLHIELDRHDVILAEGAPSESFLDDDSRGAFHNAAEYADLYPEAPAPGRFCASLVENGPLLDAIRRRLDGRNVHEVPLDGEGLHRIAISDGVCAVRLITGSGYAPGDARRLGGAVSRIALDGAELLLDDPRLITGWHSCEAAWRWTDGAALLLVSGAKALEVTFAAAPFAAAA